MDARTATPVASSLFSSQLNQSFGGRSDAAAAACSALASPALAPVGSAAYGSAPVSRCTGS